MERTELLRIFNELLKETQDRNISLLNELNELRTKYRKLSQDFEELKQALRS